MRTTRPSRSDGMDNVLCLQPKARRDHGGASVAVADPVAGSLQLLVPGGSVNYGDVTNPIYGEAINAYLAAPEDTRVDACRAMLSTIIDNAPILPVCFEKQEVCAHRGVVGGLAPTQSNIFQNIAAWTINLE